MTCDCKLWMDHAYNRKCDDVLNNEECFWDNGDCCRYPRFFGDCENCTCHEDPYTALFEHLYMGKLDVKMINEYNDNIDEMKKIEYGDCDVATKGQMCCDMGHMFPSFCAPDPPPPTCHDHCVDERYSRCMSCDECPTTTTTVNPFGGSGCLTTTTEDYFASLFGKRKKRDLGALLASLGGGGGTTTADPCGLGGDGGDYVGLLGGLGGGGGGATTTAVNPFGGLGCLGGGLGGGDPNCPCDCGTTTTAATTTDGGTTSFDMGSFDISSLLGKRK